MTGFRPARAAVGLFALVLTMLVAFSPSLRKAEAVGTSARTERLAHKTGDELSLQSRAAYQRAIDEVYWRHTAWPEASEAKPGFAAVMSPDATRAKVEDVLRKTNALSRLWRQEITGEMLQAEIQRMVRQGKRPEILREIFSSLNNDPYLIAETLARPVLVERLARNFYANDERLAGDGNFQEQDAESSFDDWWQRSKGDFSSQVVATKANYQLPDFDPIAQEAGAADTWRPMSALPVATGTVVWTGVEMIVWGGNDSGSRYNPATDTWTPTSTIGAPRSRSRHTAVWTGSEMIVWGGCNQSSSFCGDATGGRYDPLTDTWTPTSTAGAPRARKEHTAVWTGSEMLIWGGCNPGYNNFCNNIGNGAGGAYNPASDTWRSIDSPSAPSGRTKHTAVWTGAEMIVWGGSSTNIANTGGRYSPSTNTWQPTSVTNAPVPRMEHTAVWTGTEMIVWGGYDGNSQVSFNTGGRYNPASDSWAATSLTNAPPPRIGHTAVWTGTEMIVWGGDLRFSLGYTNTGGRYRPDTDSWTPTNQSNAPSARANHLAIWTGSLMIVWSTADKKSGGRYDPSSDSWTPTNNRDSSPTVYHGVWTGTEMIVWGTHPGCLSGCPSAGGRYDPALDEWRPINLAGSPPAPNRDRPVTAVWTGKEMIVWGMGENVYGAPGEGGRYNPSTDSWTPVTKVGAPVNRFYHTAVWTGSEMIVWGGQNNQGPILNTGGRYNPTTDSWQQTNTNGAPEARYLHRAVWSGTEMIVWGGLGSGFTSINTGGRYNPATNSWQPVTTGGAPIPRFFHTAVWTGSEMIIWGGRDGDYNDNALIYDTGGRYNPATDSWQPTNLNGVPLARFKHTAVWTGTEMIVWGGLAKTGVAQREVSTGARYNPAGDTWTPTAIPRAASARSAHIALWTGSEMIIWGGDASGYTGTATHGAIYTPSNATPTPTPTPSTLVNFALSSNGGAATVSSSYNSNYPASSLNNGDRRGLNWNAGGGWNDATGGAYPDWVEVAFSGEKSIEQIDLFTLQDNPGSPQEPTEAQTFSQYGITGFEVRYWDGSSWSVVPGGVVTGNDKVWRHLAFSPISTTKIRVVITGAMAGYSRLVEVEAWGTVSGTPSPTPTPTPTPTPSVRTNVALSSNGGVASVSSSYNQNYPASSLINGDRRGMNWNAGGGWNDATANGYPDWVEVAFAGERSIEEVDVFTLQDSPGSPVEPTEVMAFTSYGITNFEVQYWNGASWANVPGGSITGNNLVWRKLTFPSLTTTKIRVLVSGALAGYSRITEVEAWQTGSVAPARTNHALGASATASSTYNASYTASSVINGDRRGLNWNSGGGWNDATPNGYPDWLELTFDGAKTLTEVDVFSLQDNAAAPSEPTEAMTFSNYGITDFEVQYWDAATVGWKLVEGGAVTGNDRVWRKVTFPAVTTTKIKVVINGALAGYSRITEIEAY